MPVRTEKLLDALKPLRERQRRLDTGGFEQAVSGAKQLYKVYIDSYCAGGISFEAWQAK